jgi:hypothetical protein
MTLIKGDPQVHSNWTYICQHFYQVCQQGKQHIYCFIPEAFENYITKTEKTTFIWQAQIRTLLPGRIYLRAMVYMCNKIQATLRNAFTIQKMPSMNVFQSLSLLYK